MKKLKKWQIVLIVILALGVIGALAGRGDEEKKTASRQQRKPTTKRKKTKRRSRKRKPTVSRTR